MNLIKSNKCEFKDENTELISLFIENNNGTYEKKDELFKLSKQIIEKDLNSINLLTSEFSLYVLSVNNKLLTIKKLANYLSFEDTIPKIFSSKIFINNKEEKKYLMEFIKFGNTQFDFINKISGFEGAISLYSLFRLIEQNKMTYFLTYLDIISFQKVLIFSIISGHSDINHRNVMLKYDNNTNKIKFKLIDFNDSLNYEFKNINYNLLIFQYGIFGKLLNKAKILNNELYENLKKINIINLSEIIPNKINRKRFIQVINIFIKKLNRNIDLIEYIKNFIISFNKNKKSLK